MIILLLIIQTINSKMVHLIKQYLENIRSFT